MAEVHGVDDELELLYEQGLLDERGVSAAFEPLDVRVLSGKREVIEAEAATYGLLGQLLASQPDPAWITELVKAGVFDEVPLGCDRPAARDGLEILGVWVRAALATYDGPGDASMEAAGTYFRLFEGAGSPPAPLWESVYFNDKRMAFGEQTLEVRRSYGAEGLAVERKNAQPDDNIGLELLFVAHLSQVAVNALAQGEGARASDTLAVRNDFLEEHLLSWAFDWAALVADASCDAAPVSGLAFWHGVALLVCAALEATATTWRLAARNQTLLKKGR